VTFAPPTVEAQLAALQSLANELPALTGEAPLVERVLDVTGALLPGRALCVRVIDLRTRDPARA